MPQKASAKLTEPSEKKKKPVIPDFIKKLLGKGLAKKAAEDIEKQKRERAKVPK